MKVLIVNDSDSLGGAARAATRQFKALSRRKDIDCFMVVRLKSSDLTNIYTTKRSFFNMVRPKINNFLKCVFLKRSKTLFSCSFLSNGELISIIKMINPDIVHLHWVANGMLATKDLLKFNCPIVWSLHDQWPFTGGCHYDDGCDKFKISCQSCKVLHSNVKYDFSYFNFNEKKYIYKNIERIYINGLSKWITEKAVSSNVFPMHTKFTNIPNAIDTEIFKPFKKKVKIINHDKICILVGSASKKDDPRKGAYLLVQALELITNIDIELNIVGNDFYSEFLPEHIKVNFWGNIDDDRVLADIYNASDLTIVPSKQENLSNMIMESMSCGTPVVAFDIGGNSDMISHKENGYLATAFNSQDLCDGILWVYENNNKYDISVSARNKVKECFSYDVVSNEYIDLYNIILSL
jgi:glycosyltransferase involved in cell wall biosynthesis